MSKEKKEKLKLNTIPDQHQPVTIQGKHLLDSPNLHTRIILLEQSVSALAKNFSELEQSTTTILSKQLTAERNAREAEHSAIEAEIASISKAVAAEHSHSATCDVIIDSDKLRLKAHEGMIDMISKACTSLRTELSSMREELTLLADHLACQDNEMTLYIDTRCSKLEALFDQFYQSQESTKNMQVDTTMALQISLQRLERDMAALEEAKAKVTVSALPPAPILDFQEVALSPAIEAISEEHTVQETGSCQNCCILL
jgi:DNA repair exonuclease SbcCD ATPase subunit